MEATEETMKKRKVARASSTDKPAPQKLKPMSPPQAEKAQKSVDWLYEYGDAKFYTDQWYDQQKAFIAACSALWGKQ